MKGSDPILLFENPYGVRFLRKDYKTRSKVEVRSGNDKYLLMTYRMPNLPFYEHPLLSWKNLDQCNGWAHDEKYLYTAVQHGQKPVADITIIVDLRTIPQIKDDIEALDAHYDYTVFDETYGNDADIARETYAVAKKQFDAQCKDIDPKRVYACVNENEYINEKSGVNGYSLGRVHFFWHFLIIKKGKLSDLFNIDEIISAYKNNGIILSKETLSRFFDMDMVELATNKLNITGAPNTFKQGKIPKDYETILTGLLLGYPLESTASLLNGY